MFMGVVPSDDDDSVDACLANIGLEEESFGAVGRCFRAGFQW